jgi:hypothetical protein
VFKAVDSSFLSVILRPVPVHYGRRFQSVFQANPTKSGRGGIDTPTDFSSGSRISNPQQLLVSILTGVSGNDGP